MKWCVGPLGLLLVVLTSAVQGILIVGPKRIYPGRRYTMVMSNFFNRTVDLSLTLKGSDNEYTTTKNVDVRPNANKLLDFDIPDYIEDGDYMISIIGKNGFSFKEDVELVYESKSMYGLIQLDKPVYKPGDTVNFRVIVVDSELKPPKHVSNVAVNIQTPTKADSARWNEAPLKTGVFEGSFHIAPDPSLGTYKITVESDGEELAIKTFDVKEYMLFGLNVDVYPTRVPLQEHQAVDLTVSATNVFGNPIRGIIQLTLIDNDSLIDVKATKNVHGSLKLTMAFNKELHVYEDFKEFMLNFTFTEDYTNRTIAKSVPLKIYSKMYRALLIKDSQVFYPGYPFKATIKLQYQDGSSASYVKCLVEINDKKFEQVSNNNGEIPIHFIPTDNDDTIEVTVEVGDQGLLEEEIQKAVSSSGAYIKIEFRSDVQINKPIKLKIQCRKEVTFLMYYVLAKGNVIDQGYMRIKRKSKVNIEIKYLDSMVPKAKVFVATVSGDAVVYDMRDIVFRDLSNDFDMEIDSKVVKPGEQIELKMKGRAESYVALAAYDKGLLQYGSTHDLYWNDVQQMYDNFYGNVENEHDIFQSVGLFARVSQKLHLSQALSTATRNGHNPLVEYRTEFAESFLWMHKTMDRSGRDTVTEYVPDSTTVWCVTGFSMHQDYGLGIVKTPIQFNSIKAFYIVDHLPYSIKQDEVVALQFTIFSYLGGDYVTKITLFNAQNQFEFIEQIAENSKTMTVQQSVGTRVSFLVKAKKLGEVAVRVRAKNLLETDAIEKVIRVMPKSITHKKLETRIFCSKTYTNISHAFNLNIEQQVNVGSTKISFTIEPNILSGVIENIGNLIKVPTGSGEANMINFVPNVAVLDYLTAMDPNHPLIKKTQELLQSGYQNQLKYHVSDGSFRDFEGSNSSIFLTAFVAKLFQVASKYLQEVNAKMVDKAFDWLASQQKDSGHFEEIGLIVLQDFQSNSRQSIVLTSYVVIAFLENPTANRTHSKVVEKAIQYILKHKDSIEDVLDLAIATYALSLHSSNSKIVKILNEKLISKSYYNETNDQIHWQREKHSIEATSYALLTLIKDDTKYQNGINIMMWLVNQRFETGSFPRAQDTFIGLKALTVLADVLSPSRNDYKIDLKMVKFKKTKYFAISKDDTKQLTFDDIPVEERQLNFTFAGIGFGLLTMRYEYNLDMQNHRNRFNLEVNNLLDSNYELQIRICASYIPKLTNKRSDMALVEVTFPSGYVVDNYPITNATSFNPIQSFEIRYGASYLAVYYANMGTEENCFDVTAYRRFMVSFKRPAYVIVQDYYHPKHNAVKTYIVKQDEGQNLG